MEKDRSKFRIYMHEKILIDKDDNYRRYADKEHYVKIDAVIKLNSVSLLRNIEDLLDLKSVHTRRAATVFSLM